MIPSIEPNEVGTTGLLWLFASYGYVLFQASNLISEGSELLLLVPSLKGLVGGVVLPLLGAVPDGAIMLFSGLGDIESAQETLSVGVGALAGSTIMLLTIPWGLSVLAGSVDIRPKGGVLMPSYKSKPKLTSGRSLKTSGVALTDEITHGSFIMVLTTIPYFIIQLPASYLTTVNPGNVAEGEKWWSFLGFIVCLGGFGGYLYLHVMRSKEDEERFHRTEVMKTMLRNGTMSLSGAFHDIVKVYGHEEESGEKGYEAIMTSTADPPPKVKQYLTSVLKVPFQKYDRSGDGLLDLSEIKVFLHDLNENVSEDDLKTLFHKYDENSDNQISFEEFVKGTYSLILKATNPHMNNEEDAKDHFDRVEMKYAEGVRESMRNLDDTDESGEEEEEIPEEIKDLPASEQEAAIKKKAFTMLAIGTAMVLLFADPMVDVMQEIAVRVNIPPFYVSFVLAPLASNASEVLASQYYASKKTTQTMTVSLSALQGAACMNNTFCLSIFMGLIFFRGLAWQYTAETIAIVLVQFAIYAMTRSDYMTCLQGIYIILLFPLSVAMIAILEAFGMD